MVRTRLAILLLLAPTAALAADAEPARRAPRIGVVNIDQVVEELTENIEMNAQLEVLKEKRNTALKDLSDRILTLEKRAKVLNPDSGQGKKTLQELHEAKAQLRARRRVLDTQFLTKTVAFRQAIYRRIVAEVRAYATEGAYDIVLRVRDPEVGAIDPKLPPGERLYEFLRRVELRNVLYARASHNFTGPIIKRMNAKYERTKAERPKDKPTPEKR